MLSMYFTTFVGSVTWVPPLLQNNLNNLNNLKVGPTDKDHWMDLGSQKDCMYTHIWHILQWCRSESSHFSFKEMGSGLLCLLSWIFELANGKSLTNISWIFVDATRNIKVKDANEVTLRKRANTRDNVLKCNYLGTYNFIIRPSVSVDTGYLPSNIRYCRKRRVGHGLARLLDTLPPSEYTRLSRSSRPLTHSVILSSIVVIYLTFPCETLRHVAYHQTI